MPKERDYGFIALYIAIEWYKQIPLGRARKIAEGRLRSKPGNEITPEMAKRIKKIIHSPNFKNLNGVVRRFRVNKYDVYEYFGGENAREEVITAMRIESLLLRAKNIVENCTAMDCENCVFNQTVCANNNDEISLCDVLLSLEFTESGKLKGFGNRGVHKSAQKCTEEFLNGETVKKGFEVYQKVLNQLDQYIDSHKDKKIKDIVSAAILEYVERHGPKKT